MIGVSIAYVFMSYNLLWYIAGTFDLEFIQNPTWRQYWGISLIFSLFTFPFVYNKVDKEKSTTTAGGWYKWLSGQTTLLFGLLFVYLFAMLVNWLL
jgi:hypothetical protein